MQKPSSMPRRTEGRDGFLAGIRPRSPPITHRMLHYEQAHPNFKDPAAKWRVGLEKPDKKQPPPGCGRETGVGELSHNPVYLYSSAESWEQKEEGEIVLPFLPPLLPRPGARIPLVLERNPGELTQRGMPEGGLLTTAAPSSGTKPPGGPSSTAAASSSSASSVNPNSAGYNYFVLVRQGRSVTAFPADQVYQFKPIIK